MIKDFEGSLKSHPKLYQSLQSNEQLQMGGWGLGGVGSLHDGVAAHDDLADPGLVFGGFGGCRGSEVQRFRAFGCRRRA